MFKFTELCIKCACSQSTVVFLLMPVSFKSVTGKTWEQYVGTHTVLTQINNFKYRVNMKETGVKRQLSVVDVCWWYILFNLKPYKPISIVLLFFF